MAALKQTGVISTDQAPDIEMYLMENSMVRISQGNDDLVIHEDDFRSFLELASAWFETRERFGSK